MSVINKSLLVCAAAISMSTARPLDRVGQLGARNPRGGMNKGVHRVVNGENSPEDKYPWVVALDAKVKGDSSTYSCGGSLISPTHILTAAHCFYPTRSGETGKAYFGSHETCFYGDCDAETRKIVKAIAHPKYNQKTMANDIAILELDKPIYTIEPVPLHKKPFTANENFGNHKEAMVLGWGTINTKTEAMSDVLQLGKVNLVNRNSCKRKYSYSKSEIKAGMFCAIGKKQGTDACQGDSGGPLFVSSLGEQVGVVSWGNGCGEESAPGVYADIGTYYAWIDGIAKLDLNKPNVATQKPVVTKPVVTTKKQVVTTPKPATTEDGDNGGCSCLAKWSFDTGDGYKTFSGCASTSGDNQDHWCYTDGKCAGSSPSALFGGWQWAACTPDADNSDSGAGTCTAITNGKKCRNSSCKWSKRQCSANPEPGTCASFSKNQCTKETTFVGTKCQLFSGQCIDTLVCEKGSSKFCGKNKNQCKRDTDCNYERNKSCMPIN